MAYRTKKFDAKAYWANKPLCIVCKKYKVKNGTTCHECRKLEEKIRMQLPKEKSSHKPIIEMNTENIQEKNTEDNVPNGNFGISVSAKVQNKIVRLFTYLEKALALDDLISEILIYFENRLKIIVVSDKLKHKINSVPEAVKAYKNLAMLDVASFGDINFLKILDRTRGEKHHTHHRYDTHYFIGRDDYNTIDRLQALCRKVRSEIQNIDQKLAQTRKDYEIKVDRLPSAIKAEWTAVNHALDMTQGGKIVSQRPTTGLDPRQVKYFAIQLNYKK